VLQADEGAAAFTTNRVAAVAGAPVGSVYHYFQDKQSLVEALALRYWGELEDLVRGVAETDERDPLPNPAGLDALTAGIRNRPGFLALWFGGLRTERVRDVTRPTRTAIAASLSRIFALHWPDAAPEDRDGAAHMVVIAGDGLVREAFRSAPDGDRWLLAEGRAMLDAYVAARLGPAQR